MIVTRESASAKFIAAGGSAEFLALDAPACWALWDAAHQAAADSLDEREWLMCAPRGAWFWNVEERVSDGCGRFAQGSVSNGTFDTESVAIADCARRNAANKAPGICYVVMEMYLTGYRETATARVLSDNAIEQRNIDNPAVWL